MAPRRRPGTPGRETGATDHQHHDPPTRLLVAVVAYQGVLADESDVFRDLLVELPEAHVITVGEHLGTVAGPGGAHEVDATFDDVPRADVVVVPGGLGAHRHPEIAAWLQQIRPRFVVASSTGSALLAASGLLTGRTAVTHWLARPLLEQHGVTVSSERMAVDLPYVTCSGLASCFDAAFEVARRIGGPTLVREMRQRVEARQEPPAPPPSTRQRRKPRRQASPRPPSERLPGTVVEVELEPRA
jgi:transcriptional regulator GlxA family with amidase domain